MPLKRNHLKRQMNLPVKCQRNTTREVKINYPSMAFSTVQMCSLRTDLNEEKEPARFNYTVLVQSLRQAYVIVPLSVRVARWSVHSLPKRMIVVSIYSPSGGWVLYNPISCRNCRSSTRSVCVDCTAWSSSSSLVYCRFLPSMLLSSSTLISLLISYTITI